MTAYSENKLVALSDTDEITLDPGADVRGFKVVDKSGEALGKVHDLLVDEGEGKVRALIVNHGHLLEKTSSVIPIDAITGVSDGQVTVDLQKQTVADSAVYDPTIVYDDAYYGTVYDYYGYVPYWYDDYAYPGYLYYV